MRLEQPSDLPSHHHILRAVRHEDLPGLGWVPQHPALPRWLRLDRLRHPVSRGTGQRRDPPRHDEQRHTPAGAPKESPSLTTNQSLTRADPAVQSTRRGRAQNARPTLWNPIAQP
jgi:hypothetical protein